MAIRIQFNPIIKTLIPILFLVFPLMVIATGCGKESRAEEGTSAPATDSVAVQKAESSRTDSAAAADSSKAKELAANAIPVEVEPVQRGEVYDCILMNAPVETENGVEVYSRLIGEVVSIKVEEGSRVRQGDELCRLDDGDYRLSRDKAKVQYEKNKADYERLENMFKQQLVSEKEFEDGRFSYEQARIEWEQAELNLRRTLITAPISGVIATRFIRQGERVTTSEPVFSIVEMNEKIAVVHLPEREAGKVQLTQRALLETENLPDNRFEAVVKRISPVMDAASGTFKVTIGIRDVQNLLKPGMYTSIRIITDTHHDALLIPKSAVVYDNGLPYAFFISQDTLARRVRVQKGYSDTRNIEILNGADENDRVIVIGQNGLKDGARIKVTPGILKDDQEISSRDTLLNEEAL